MTTVREDDTVCDSCQEPYPFNDLTYVVVFNATHIDPEEGVLLCAGCIGETE